MRVGAWWRFDIPGPEDGYRRTRNARQRCDARSKLGRKCSGATTTRFGAQRIVYLETAASGQTAEDAGTVADLELLFDTLRTEACKGTESLALIESAAGKCKP